MTVILYQVQGGVSPRSVTAAQHPTHGGPSLRSVTAGRHLTPVRLVAIKAATREEAAASRVRTQAVGVDVGAEVVAGVRPVATRANSRGVAKAASGAGTGPWRR